MGSRTPSDEGHWVSIADASSELGVSVDTIRRRIKRQELLAKREQRAQGFRWLVLVHLEDEASDRSQATASASLSDAHPGANSTHHEPDLGTEAAPTFGGGNAHGQAAPRVVAAVLSEREELIRELRHQIDVREREASELRSIIARQASALEQAARLQVLTATASPSSPSSAAGRQGDPGTASGDREGSAVMSAPERPSAATTARHSRRRRLWRWLTGVDGAGQ